MEYTGIKSNIILLYLNDYENMSEEEINYTVNKKQRHSIDSKPAYNKNNKAVVQLELNGKFVKEWNSIKEAANKLRISAGNISSCLKGRYSQTGGFKWVYSKDYYAQ